MGTSSSKLISSNNPYIFNSTGEIDPNQQQQQLNNTNNTNNTNNNLLSPNNNNSGSNSNSSSSNSLGSYHTLTPSNSSSSLSNKQSKRKSKRNSSVDSKLHSAESSSSLSTTTTTTTTTTTNTTILINCGNNNINNNLLEEKEINNNSFNNMENESNLTVNNHNQEFNDQSSNSNLSISSLNIVCEHCNHCINPKSINNQIQQLSSSTNNANSLSHQHQPPTIPLNTSVNFNSFSFTAPNLNSLSITSPPPPPSTTSLTLSNSITNTSFNSFNNNNNNNNNNNSNSFIQLPSINQNQDTSQTSNILAASLGSTSDLFKNSLISTFLNQNQNQNGLFTSISPPVTPRYKDTSYDSKDYLTISVSQSDQVSEVSSDGLSSSKQSLKRFNDILSKSVNQTGNSNQSIGSNKILFDDYSGKENTFLSSCDQESILKDKSITSNTSSSSISSIHSSTQRSYLTASNTSASIPRPRGRSISDSLFASSQNNIAAGINDLQKALENERIKRNRYLELQSLLENKENIIDLKEISFVNKIGEGSFSEVWEGRWNGMTVAIKKLKIIGDEEQFKERFIREVQNLKNSSSNQNIVMFIGACFQPACIVTEYMQGGSLYNYLHNPREPKPRFSFPVVLKMAIDIAAGLAHLHSISIVHRDLTSQNILLDELGNVKISDFGLSRVKSQEGSMTMTNGGICNPRWRPPEITKNIGHYSEKVDVYCYSLVVWEILTGEIPFSDLDGSQASAQVAYAGLRPLLPESCDADFKKLLQQCWDSDPNNRPSFTEVVTRLKEIYHNNPLGFLSVNGTQEFLNVPDSSSVSINSSSNSLLNSPNNNHSSLNNNQSNHSSLNNSNNISINGSNSSSSSTK